MTGLDIEAIRQRSEEVQRFREDPSSALAHHNFLAATADSAHDVPLLLAEVERLTVEARNAEFEVVRLRGELAGANAEVGKLREWNDEIKAERDALAEAAIQHEADLRDARAATADALQVIADLRGGTP